MDDGHLKISDFGVPNKFKEKIYNTGKCHNVRK
jgi:hypothetical protein